MKPLLGWIAPQDRTQEQHAAHSAAQASIPPAARFGLPVPTVYRGQKVCLYDFWKAAEVVADVGFVFDRIHQATGSCVWAGGTNAVFSTIAAQRLASASPTKAFLPFTLHNYALSRHYMGDDSQGDGSMGSTFAKSLTQDGITDWSKDGGYPAYEHKDGIEVGSSAEYSWSTVRNGSVAKVREKSKEHLFGAASEASSVQDIKAFVLNGYGVSFACNNYIGNARVVGEGQDACVVGHWDGRGGHQQSIHAYWEHPGLGPLYWAQNNWPGSTYPRDPAGGPICGCWVKEADVASAMRMDGEVYGLSHLNWFPAQPKVLDWFA